MKKPTGVQKKGVMGMISPTRRIRLRNPLATINFVA
jgi:hypothetical protein